MVKLEKLPVKGQGMGRIKRLEKPVTLRKLVDEVKEHVGVEKIRVCVAVGKTLGEYYVLTFDKGGRLSLIFQLNCFFD